MHAPLPASITTPPATRRRDRWARRLRRVVTRRGDERQLGIWFLVAATTGLWFTRQATRPVALPKRRAIASFFAGWLTSELVPHHLLWQSVATGIFVRKGALEARTGRVALGVVGLQWVLMLRLLRDAMRARTVVEQALRDALGDDYRRDLPDSAESWDRLRVRGLAVPFVSTHPAVSRDRNLVYARVAARELKLDVFAPATSSGRRRPAIIYVHGGGWVLGFRDRQGGPLLTEMAARGWVGFLPGYRLSPVATYPDHLVDVKRAIAWVREHADAHQVDPDHVVIAGGSAGGHLAAMAALTANDPALQPGFEDADTSVQACVPLYGVYDVGEHVDGHLDDFERFLARYVVKADVDDGEAWDRFRPVANLTGDAPPFLVVHGERDTLTSPREAQRFAARLREVSRSPVAYAQLPGGQHAFDVFPSVRTAHVLRGVARFLAVTRARAPRLP